MRNADRSYFTTRNMKLVSRMAVTAMEQCRRDSEGQFPLFDAPLPELVNAAQPLPHVKPEHKRFTKKDIEHLKSVLLAKYLHRVLKLTHRKIAAMLNVDAGTATRLANYNISIVGWEGIDATPADQVVWENGIVVQSRSEMHRLK